MGSVGGSAKNYSPFDVLSRNQYLLFHETVSDFAAIKGLSKNDSEQSKNQQLFNLRMNTCELVPVD